LSSASFYQLYHLRLLADFAGRTSHGTQTDHALIFNPDHPIGAEWRPCMSGFG
jgi:hypothetical protein